MVETRVLWLAFAAIVVSAVLFLLTGCGGDGY
jgi:hypothetical protein